MTERSKLSSIVFEAMPSTYIAASQTYLPQESADEINKFAWFTKKHNDLQKLNAKQANIQFQALDPRIQSAMSELFDTNYSDAKEPSTFFNTIKNFAFRPVGGLFEGLRDYTETVISNPFRQADAAVRETGANWDETYNGEAYFDQERAAAVDNFYGPVVGKVAKLIASGKRPGEVLLLLETDAEYDAFERMMNGDEEFDRAIKEYNDAKVSFGRRMFGYLQPGAGAHGLERKVYNFASGAGDLAYQIFADPLTYATVGYGTGVRLFGKTLVQGTRSLTRVLEAPDRGYALDKLFNRKGVTEYWDRLGGIIDNLASDDKAKRVAAANQIKIDFPEITDEFKEILRKGVGNGKPVKNAEDAKIFFMDADNVGRLMTGQGLSKLNKSVMPAWKTSRRIKSKLRSATSAFIRGEIDELKEIGTISQIVAQADNLARLETRDFELLGGGAEAVKELKKRRGVIGSVERLASRYPIFPTVNIGDDYAKSSELIFQMARTYLPRWHANGVRDEFEKAEPYTRFLMLKGMYVQMAQSMGLTDTREGREFLSQQIKNQFGGQYGVGVYYSPETLSKLKYLTRDADSITNSGNLYSPGEVNGISVANQWFNSKPVVASVDLANWKRMSNDFNSKFPLARDGAAVGNALDEANNHWGFFTLFPRNGMRSALEELIFYGLEGSVRDFLNYFRARGISRARRRTLAPQEQTLTAKIGYQTSRWSGRYSDQEFAEALTDEKKFAELQIKNAVEEIRRSPFGKVASLFPAGKQSPENTTKWIKGLYEYGHLREMGAELTTTSIQSAQQIRKGIASSPAALESNYGLAEAVRFNWDMIYAERLGVFPAKGIKKGDKIVRARTARPEKIEVVSSPEDIFGMRKSAASWHGSLLSQIEADRLGSKIILDNINNPEVAVEALIKHYKNSPEIMRTLTGSVMYRELLATRGEQFALGHMAENQMLTLRNLISDGNDKVIDEVVESVITRNAATVKEAFVKLNEFYPEQLIDTMIRTKRAPTTIHGYQYILATEDPSNVASKLAMLEEKGYNFMQRQVDMTAREPIFIARYMSNRQELDKAEKVEVTRLVSSGYTAVVAEQIADQKFSNIAYQNAIERTIAYMDNPKVRSTLAFHARNFARFYRATEDFYRRSARLGTNNPDVLIRLRLSLVGLDSSGFIHQDEEGEDYFIYPADDIIYQTINTFTTALGQQPALEVMPVEFTSKISMFTPSLDPDSGLPAFNGPVVAVPISAIKYILGKTDMVPGDIEGAFNRYTMGIYSENSTFLDMVIPTGIRKAVNVLSAASKDEGNKQIQSAVMAAAAYNTAAGLSINDKDDFEAQARKRAQLLTTAANIITIRNVIGFFAPASIQMEEIKDLPDYVLETGTTRLSSEYYTIVNGLAEKGSADPWGEALAIFTRKNPGRLAYTVPRSENTGIIKINKTKEAADWVRENGALIKKYGTTAVLFAPQIGEFDINAYSYLKNQGYTQNRDLDDFLLEITTKKSRRDYDEIKNFWAEKINSTSVDSIKSIYRSQASDALRSFKDSNPLLKEQLEQFEFNTYLEQESVTELRMMLEAGDAPNARLARQLRLMLKVYDSARSIWSYSTTGGQLSPEQVREIRNDSIAQLERIAGNDPALQLAINKLFAPVLERSR